MDYEERSSLYYFLDSFLPAADCARDLKSEFLAVLSEWLCIRDAETESMRFLQSSFFNSVRDD